jgi:hypothetical protein
MYQNSQGQRFCVFFRGLCAAQLADAFHNEAQGVRSALVRPIDEVFREPAYHTVSFFVAVEDMLRAQTNPAYCAKPVADRVSELAQRLRTDISSASQRTFDQLTMPLHVRPTDCNSKSLAFYPGV